MKVDISAILGQIGLALASGGVLVTLVNAVFGRKKAAADADSIAVATANSLLTGLSAEVGRLRTRLTTLEDELQEAERRAALIVDALDLYRRRVAYLTALLASHGIEVEAWSPPPLEKVFHD